MRSGMCGERSCIEIGIECLDPEFSTFLHCVPGVKHQIHNDLFEERGIGFDVAEIRVKVDRKLDVVAEYGWQHIGNLGRQGIKIEHAWLKDLLPAECQ